MCQRHDNGAYTVRGRAVWELANADLPGVDQGRQFCNSRQYRSVGGPELEDEGPGEREQAGSYRSEQVTNALEYLADFGGIRY